MEKNNTSQIPKDMNGKIDGISYRCPKEKQKFQFESEEQAFEVCSSLSGTSDWETDLKRLKEKGYIRKSELQTLVDEAEGMYEKYSKYYDNSETMRRLYSALQALKKSHPEFKE